MHVGANLATLGHGKRKEEKAEGELPPILVLLSLDCVDEVFSCLACCIV